jgi:hypothetical protein
MSLVVVTGVVIVVGVVDLVVVDNPEVVDMAMGVVEVLTLVCQIMLKGLVTTVASLVMCQVTVGARVAFVVESTTRCMNVLGTQGLRTIRVLCLLVP